MPFMIPSEEKDLKKFKGRQKSLGEEEQAGIGGGASKDCLDLSIS